jgi:hypothetical protein
MPPVLLSVAKVVEDIYGAGDEGKSDKCDRDFD